MPKVYELNQIKEVLDNIDPIQAIEQGFIALSQGKAVIPPIGELIFENPPGDMHIKYGCIKDNDYYVIKVASGFYENYKQGIPNYDGLMMVFSQKTGQLLCILLDQGYLTNVRTAAAGAVAAKYLAPPVVTCIGIFGAGIQGRMQVEFLKSITECKDLIVWGINQEELDRYEQDMGAKGYNVQTTRNAEDVASQCNLIITATPAKSPLLHLENVSPGIHITAMGADTPEKNELDPRILQRADIVAADSLSQCKLRGEIFKALQAGSIQEDDVVELGDLIINPEKQRKTEDQITVVDLTGVAIQDIQISVAVYKALSLRIANK